MKKFFNYLLLALVVVCAALPLGGRAEAAKVAVVPLANHVAGDEVAGTNLHAGSFGAVPLS